MNNIKSYIVMNKKTSSITNLFIIISIVIIMSLVIISNCKYKKYFHTIWQVVKEENNYQLSLYLYPYQLKIIKNNNKLTIDNKEYNYNISYIKNEYIYINNNSYLKVVLNINLDNKDKIINNNLEIKILESNKKIFCYIKEYLKRRE